MYACITHLDGLVAIGHHGDQHVEQHDHRDDVVKSVQGVAHALCELVLPYLVRGVLVVHDDVSVRGVPVVKQRPEQSLVRVAQTARHRQRMSTRGGTRGHFIQAVTGFGGEGHDPFVDLVKK